MTTRLVAGNDSAFSFVRLKYGDLATDTVSGVIIYPDDFSFAEAGVGMLPFGDGTPIDIDNATWEALEESGCVFLPGSVSRNASEAQPSFLRESFGNSGNYFTSTAVSANTMNDFSFNLFKIYAGNSSRRNNGFFVRLAQDL